MAVPLRAKLRYADLANTPDDGKRYELLDGVLVVTPSPTLVHQRVSRRLVRRLEDFFVPAGLAEVFAAPTDVLLSDHDVLVPDIVVVTSQTPTSVAAIEGPPLLVVEILSPSSVRFDRGAKSRRYAAFDVPHYWVVDPDAQVIECYRNVDGQFLEVMRASDGVFMHPDFAGLAFDMAGLWSREGL